MSDEPGSFNPYQPTDAPLGSSEDPRFVAEHVSQVARWQMIVAVCVSLTVAIILISMLVRSFGSGDPASYFVETLLCPLALMVVVFVIPVVELWKSVGAARQFGQSASGIDFSAFAASQRSLWRTFAILAILMFAVFALMMFVAMLSDSVTVGVGN